VTLPLTDLSSFTVIVPLPDAEVLTGGTSSLPLSVTLLPLKKVFVESHAEFIVSHPASANAVDAITAGIVARNMSEIFMESSCWLDIGIKARDVMFRAIIANTCARKIFQCEIRVSAAANCLVLRKNRSWDHASCVTQFTSPRSRRFLPEPDLVS
jgi:hypothetical protein